MRDRRGELDMTHTFTTHERSGHFHAALVADNSFVTNFFVFTTVTFPIFGRTKNFFSEEAAFFRFLSAVVDGFRLVYFAERPSANRLR